MEPQPSRRWGWWAWLWILVAFVALSLLTLVLWVRSDSDMVAVEARLRELGLPMTWKDLGLPAPTASQRATMDRLRQLAAAAKEYPESYRWQDPFLPVSPELRAWAQRHGSGVDADLDAALDAADGGLWLTAETEAFDVDLANGTWPKSIWEDDPRWRLATVLLERGMAADAAEAPALVQRMACLVRLKPPQRYWMLMPSLRIAERWAVMAVRWREVVPASTASMARAMADDLDRVLRVETEMWMLHLLHLARSDLLSAANYKRITLPAIMDNPIVPPLMHRAGRAPMIQRNIEMVRQTRLYGPVRTLSEINRRAPPEPSRGYWDLLRVPELFYSVMFDQAGGGIGRTGRTTVLHYLHREHLRVTTKLRLLAADLSGQPWPADPCDPAGKPLRPILRDGRVIGAYSFGPDGLDGGGDRSSDWCWPLCERLGKTKASDPPEDPPP